MEIIKLNLIPSGATPVVHVKQYDIGRTWRFELYEGAAVYTLDGTEVLECDVKKLDGNIVTVAVTNTSSTYVDIETTVQMTACSGDQIGALRITKGGDDIATLNFILACQRSPLEGGITSDSAIHNLQTQVAGYVAAEVADQYDSANVIFDAVPTSGHGNGYTVTSEGIKTALNAKANTADLAPVATSGNYNDLSNKPTIPTVTIYNLFDTILNVMGGTLRGFGSAMITLCDGKARIDFNLKITVDENTPNITTWGINRDYFTAITGKTIQPVAGGVVTYYNNEQVYANRIDLGGTFQQNGQFWQPARVYDDGGVRKVGGWSSSNFASGQRLIGTCYGTYT